MKQYEKPLITFEGFSNVDVITTSVVYTDGDWIWGGDIFNV